MHIVVSLHNSNRTVDVSTGDNLVGILTGDVVSSSDFEQDVRATLPHHLRTVGEHIRDNFEHAVPYSIDIFRGDSWQLVVAQPKWALRVALDVRCVLHSLDPDEPILTRIGIGIGDFDFIPADSVSEGDGTAFRLSGQALEELDRHRHLAIRIADAYASAECRALPVTATLIDAIANRWTAKQSLAVSGALRGLTQEQIGAAWPPHPISQQAVAQHLESAGWNAVSKGLAFFELVVEPLSNHAASAAASDERRRP